VLAATVVMPSDTATESRSSPLALKAAASPVHAGARIAPDSVVPLRTSQRSAPSYKIVPIAQLLKAGLPPKIAGPIFRGGAPSKAVAPAPPTKVTPRTPSTPTAPRIAVYGNGVLNNSGMSAMGNATGLTPPDSTGAIGPNNYVEMDNSNIAVWKRSDLTNVSINTLHDFIGDAADDPFCDPQVQWDPTAGRWLFLFLYCNVSTSTQFFVVGWSKTADPTNLLADNGNPASGWCAFGVNTSPRIFDYPKLGHSSKSMIVGGNFYNESSPSPNPPFETAAIAWITKPANGTITTCTSTSINGTTTNPLKNADQVTNAFTPVPVNTMTGSANGYVVSAYDPSGGNGQGAGTRHKLAVWHLDSSGVLHQHSDIGVANFTFPSPAPQLGTANTLDTLDGRLTQAVGDPATGLWFQHTVDGPGGRSVVRWYEIKVVGSVASLTQQGDIASATDWVFNGAISPRRDALGAAVFYNRSGPSIYPLIAAQDRLSSTTAGAMEPGELVLATSTAADGDFSCSGSPCRWGDYSAASPDPIQTNLVWGTNEWILPFGGPVGFPQWDDRNFAVSFVGTPSNVAATANDGSAAVGWTPATLDPGTPIVTYTVRAYVGASIVKSMIVPGPAGAVIVSGLTNGLTYTFTVIANVIGASGPESAHGNAVTPTRVAVQVSPLPTPTRDPASQSTPVPTPAPR
jgi:hypothetical protein